MHRRLTLLNRVRLQPSLPGAPWRLDTALLEREHDFLEASRQAIRTQVARAPTEPDAFLAWFEALEANGPGQRDPLFPWLAETASLEDMKWFLTQEVAGEAGFDDLVALVQVKMPAQPKLELANNYWDEMGRGNIKGLHGAMLDKLVQALDLKPKLETTVVEALALANTMCGLVLNRCYAYHAIGALGAIELTAPGRSAHVAAGLKRLGVEGKLRHYFELHAVLDLKHSADWNREVLHPLVAADPRQATAIAEGALMRLTCGARCFERYRHEMGLST